MVTYSIEELPEYKLIVIDNNGNIIHGIKVHALKPEYELRVQIEEGISNI